MTADCDGFTHQESCSRGGKHHKWLGPIMASFRGRRTGAILLVHLTRDTVKPHRSVALLFLVSPMALASAGAALAQPRPIDTQHSMVTVRVFKSGLFRAFADNHVIQAPIGEGSVDESGTPHVNLAVDAARMRVTDPGLSPADRDEVQARMLGPDVLDTNRFSKIFFNSTDVRPLEPDRWLVHGNLDLHGRVRQVVIKVVRENGRYTGSTTLLQSDFGISPISIVGGTVKVKDEVTIEFDIVTADR